MNRLTSKQRKLLYVVCIAVLLAPIIWLGMPATGETAAGEDVSGGVLAQLRHDYDLGEHNLGNVDPSSATMNLVLLGLRGIATDLLWLEALEQQKTKNFGQLRATVESIIMLQPHYMQVWQFQGWNLAYNVSVEWDAVEDRWYWVKEGGKFLMRGSDRNRKYPELYWWVGRILGPKIGRSDEWRFFRKFFKVDPNTKKFNGEPDPEIAQLGSRAFDDNYLAAKAWFELANLAEDKQVQHIMMRMLFRQYPVRAQFDYADVLQREGLFDEKTRRAWEIGLREWTEKFGKEEFRSPAGMIYLEISDAREIRQLAQRNGKDEKEIRHWLDRYQKTANYRYWWTRALAEAEPNTVAAHREIYQGQQLFKEGKTGPKWYRARPGVCQKLAALNLPRQHRAVMKAICDHGELILPDQLREATGMKAGELTDVLEPLVYKRKLVETVSESRKSLESGMQKFAELLAKHPSFKSEDRMVEEGLMALLYWQKILTLNDIPLPKTFPLRDLWVHNQDRIPIVENEFKREIFHQ